MKALIPHFRGRWSILAGVLALLAIRALGQTGYSYYSYTYDVPYDVCTGTQTYYYDEYGNITGYGPYVVNCDVYHDYYDVYVWGATGLDPNCSYTLSFGGDTETVSGQDSASFTATFEEGVDLPPGYVGVDGPYNCNITITVSGPSSADTDEDVTFDATLSSNPGNVTIGWSGGGSPASGDGESFTTSWSDPGTYTVTATTNTGSSGSASITISCPSN